MSAARVSSATGLLLALLLTGCDTSGAPDAGLHTTVPGTYNVARMTPGHRAHLALDGGTPRVSCHDCHAIADAGFTTPGPQLCASCHQPQQNQHHPLDAGTEPMSCLTCHVFKAKSVGVRFETWGCMRCHATAQGTKAAIDVHVERCASCHRPHEAPFTQAADCKSCHAIQFLHGAKADTVAEACQNCHPPHQPAVVASQQCLSCHQQGKKLPVAAQVSPLALFSPGHRGCGSCHTAHLFTRDTAKPCTSCHQSQLVLAPDEHQDCTSCHEQHQPRAQPKPCESCHRKLAAANTHPVPAEGKPCISCHAPHPKTADAPIAMACISCHQKFDQPEVHAPTTSCDACHPPHTGKPQRAVLCVSCHAPEVKAATSNRGHAKCDDCHAGLPHGPTVEPKPCLSCHQDKKPPQEKHPACASCHELHSAKVMTTCASCHLKATSAPLPGLHAVKRHQECKSCHAPHTPEPAEPKMCLTCHVRPSVQNHPRPPAQCTGCHLFK